MALSDAVLAIAALLLIAIIAAGLGRRMPIPFTVLLVIIGAGLGEGARHVHWLEPLVHFRLSPELVFFIFLPALIFESALNLNVRQLMRDLAPVMVLAVPALLFSTFVIGYGTAWITGLPIGTALLFGALISATDPVAVVALFKELGAPQRLTVLVEGESLFNDATAIVVFGILLGLVSADQAVDGNLLLWSGWEFIRVFLGGVLVGGLLGLLLGELGARLKTPVPGLVVLSMVLAYAAFVIGEHVFHVSGVMAAMAAALVLNGIGMARLPLNTGPSLKESWEVLALIGNALLFLLVGLSLDLLQLFASIEAILLVSALALIARAASVYGLFPAVARVLRMPRVSSKDKHIMWWGGLKGGLAIAIVLSIPDSLPAKPLLTDITVGVVLFTLLVNAPSIRPLMNWLGMNRLSDTENAELKESLQLARAESAETLDQLHHAGILSRTGMHRANELISQPLLKREPESAASEASILQGKALAREDRELERLRADGLISQYVYFDLRTALRRRMDECYDPGACENDEHELDNAFTRFESSVIKRLRERNWAAPLLARYQRKRLVQHLQRGMALLLMARAAREELAVHSEEHSNGDLNLAYEQRINRLTSRLDELRDDFPMFYRRLEASLLPRAAILRASREAAERHEHGELSTKPYNRLEESLRELQAMLPSLSNGNQDDVIDLLAKVQLLSGLPVSSLLALARHATEMNFLNGDVVIGEGEHGDALYILRQGALDVSRQGQHIGSLAAGDVFGEMALLGDAVRTATVTASESCSLLRLTRRDVMRVADKQPDLEAHLLAAKQAHNQATALTREDAE
ncbi:MAG: cation:proton antiporter [Gammaproteobacteria bacterium]